MGEYVGKDLESLGLNDRDAANGETRRVSCTVSVEGYDTWLKKFALKLALRKHFDSCGEIICLSLKRDLKKDRDLKKGILESVAYLRILGEDAEKKALELDGTDVGGWTAIVKPAQMPKDFCDHSEMLFKEQNQHCRMVVEKFDNGAGLSDIDTQIELCKLFSSCGEVTAVDILPGCRTSAFVSIAGERCEENAMALNERDGDLVVRSIYLPRHLWKKRSANKIYGYTIPSLSLKLEMEKKEEEEEKKKEEKEKEKEKEKQRKKHKRMSLF